ncbi:serine protease HtrA [Companilactobacillus paralimentarius DSM 13238 = JCM 10415]|uniref:Serine protease HtrA n=2 Tax=Companilactobacillus paralimentarius TaxID=83526 RepID=A0A0R1P9I3_9LACO|nr:trypsin-like peptidase domain-containing protein [Companilactobacillus paralimentarius]KRL29137.1 serine protease HtrA [Companilactobacillus paralimentarius DSM 13238 = JCM 10415]MDR4932949.1 trypsin-like peptidase domain-containing protein [Companilactobacillus paralimentarius]
MNNDEKKDKSESRVEEKKRSSNGKESSNNSLLKTGIVAFISAALGVVIAFAGFTYFGGSNNSSNSAAVGNTAGTTQVSNTKVNTSSSMSGAYKKVNGAVVSVINLQKQKEQSSNGDISSIFGDLFGDSGSSDSNSSDNSQSSDSNSSDSNSSDSSSSSSNSSKLQEYSEGSGVIYAKQNGKGYIVTNNHVVSGSDSLEIILEDGTKVSAKLVGTDSTTDLAVLEIPGSKVPATASFGNSDNVTPGDPVIAIGSPLGSEYATTVTQGIISATNRTVTTQDQNTGQATGEATVLQTDAAINPGNSGGPLVNAAGQIVGINSMKLASSTDGSSVEGMGFAIPSNEVVKIINQLVENGKVERPSLGIKVLDLDQITDDSQSSLKLPSSVTKGVVVYSTTSGSVAKAAGMKKYDVIVKLGDKDVKSVADLHTALYSHSVGDTVNIQYYRNGKLNTAKVHLTKKTSD